MFALGRTATRAERVLALLEAELPETSAMMRLSGLEVTDCIKELSGLGSELSGGVRATAAMVTMTEAGLRSGVATMKQSVLPALAQVETNARGECGPLILLGCFRTWLCLCKVQGEIGARIVPHRVPFKG